MLVLDILQASVQYNNIAKHLLLHKNDDRFWGKSTYFVHGNFSIFQHLYIISMQ